MISELLKLPQFAGRRIVGHYHYGTRVADNGFTNGSRCLSLRNPAVAAQRHIHLLRLRLDLDVFAAGAAASPYTAAFRLLTAYSVTDTTGGAAIADVDFYKMSDSAASVFVGRSGASPLLSGGTVGTKGPLLCVAQATQISAGATYTTGAPQFRGQAQWSYQDSGEPALLKGDGGLIVELISAGNGSLSLCPELEWLESLPNTQPGFTG